MVQAVPFTGFMNFDDPYEVINPAHQGMTRNCQFKGTQPNMRVENIPGTIELTNALLPGAGVNKTIGKFYDAIGKRIFFFNYNSAGSHGIFVFNTLLGTFQRLLQNLVSTVGSPLVFTASGTISNINIIYGDSTQGDILVFLDSVGTPSKINIQRALSSGYGTVQRSFIDVAKEPANIPPYVVYEDDTANTVNNCRKKLFRVKIRWVFDDQDKSVTSSQSVMPIPYGAFDQSVDTDPEKNCRIAITYLTGPSNVKKIEILVSNSLGNVMSDFYLVASLDKAVDAISNNDIATYLFYNDKAYTYIDVTESNQIFDYVPIAAGTQALLNGNVISYGKITEGYPNLTNFSDGTNTSNISVDEVPYSYGSYFTNFVVSQSGDSGFGTGVIHIIVRGISQALDDYTVYFTDATDVTYTSPIIQGSAAIINGLRSDALSKGFTVVSFDDNNLFISKTNVVLARFFVSKNYLDNANVNTSYNAYDWSSKFGFGLVYFDAKGRTNGAVYTQGFSVQSTIYTEVTPPADKTIFNASIYHQPPTWATYYQWVRTKNLSKQNMVQWVSDRTFKDVVALTGLIKYAYISIQSLNSFVTNNPGSPLGYSFTSGDRIRFFKRFGSDGSTVNIYGDTKDFEIIGSITNPNINGEVESGQFIKIILPETDTDFDFGVGSENYFIELYTPAQSVANNLNLYYEYGERYTIGNPGASNRLHQGMLQNQIYLTQPATFEFDKGDYYIRKRAIQTGNIFLWTVSDGGTGDTTDTILVGLDFQSSTYSDANITAQSVPFDSLDGSFDPAGDSRWFLQAIDATTFRIEGSITITFTDSSPGDIWRIYTENRFNEEQDLATFDASDATTYTIPFTSSITLEDDRIFLIMASNGSNARTATFGVTNITFTNDHVINQVCIDPNFSDYFASTVNSNGRAFVYDSNANQVTFPVMYRWGLAYQRDTNINNSNRFYPQNFDEVDRSWGSLMRMMVWDRVLTFFQERKCGWTGIYNKVISDSGGGQNLITTDNIITSNNVQYYAGDYGVGNQADGVVQSGFVYYFPDPIKGDLCRLSRDGITVLTEVYKMKTWSGVTLPKYLNSYTYPFGGNARITGVFNVRKDNVGEYLCVLQGGTSSGGTLTGETLAFDEARNSFTSFYDFAPDNMICAENVLFSFRNGQLNHHESNPRNTFYGQYYDSSITRVFNQNLLEKKTFESITQVSNACWDCPEITTNLMSYGTTPQRSNLLTQDFEQLEGNFSASFLGDINSIDGLYGDRLKGNLIVIKFRAQNATSQVTLSAVLLYYIDSPFTSR